MSFWSQWRTVWLNIKEQRVYRWSWSPRICVCNIFVWFISWCFNGVNYITTRSSATAEKQRVSCPHRGGTARPALHPTLPPSPLATPMHMVEFETCNKRTSNVPSTKPLSAKWIGHSRSFKVILIGAGRNPERCVVVMCNSCRRYFWILRRYGNGKTANSSISTTPLKFEDVPERNAFNIYKWFILPETRVIDLHFCRW